METREEGKTVTRIGKGSPRENGARAGMTEFQERGRIDSTMTERLVGRVTLGLGKRELMDVTIPFNGQVLARVPSCEPKDVAEAAKAARAVQPEWAERSVESRGRILLRFHDMLLDRQDEVLDLIQLENGKSRFDAFEEVADVANTARFYAVKSEQFLRNQRHRGVLPGVAPSYEYRVPCGLAGFIAPWNYPLTLAAGDALAALMAGNGVILKPDSSTPLTALWVVDLLHEAGLPSGLFQVVTGGGARLGPPLAEAVDFLQFTGSTETGRIVARLAGERLIGCSLELGGKNPMLVLADTNVEQAAQGAVRACFAGTGQLCISMERILVSSRLYEEFVDRFVSRTRGMRLGSGLDYGIDMGSISSRRQLEKVREHIDDAVAQGARVLCGGRMLPELGPLFHEPTVLSGVRKGMKLHDEETFGPVVSVYSFEDEEEAIAEANSTRYGLNASVWSRDLNHARSVARRIRAGSVNINDGYLSAWSSMGAPVGGMKDSGLGRRHGAAGVLKYTESQTVAVQQVPLVGVFPPRMPQQTFVKMVTRALKVWRRVPFVR